MFRNEQSVDFPYLMQVCAFPNTFGVFAEAPDVRKIDPSW